MSDDTSTTSAPSGNTLAGRAVIGAEPGATELGPFMTLGAVIRHLPEREKVSIYQLRRAMSEGVLPAYKVSGEKGVVVRFNEAREALNRLEAQGRLRRGYGTLGERAMVRDLSNVVGIEVVR